MHEFSKLKLWGIVAFGSLPFLGVINAWVNIYARNNGNYGILYLIISANVMVIPWILLTKKSEIDLSIAGAAYDAIYSLFYFIAIVLMGQPATFIQWVGFGITILGIALMAL